MLDLVAVLTTGGVLLWAHSAFNQDYQHVITRVIEKVLIETTAVGTVLAIGPLEVRWTIHHELGLLFLVLLFK